MKILKSRSNFAALTALTWHTLGQGDRQALHGFDEAIGAGPMGWVFVVIMHRNLAHSRAFRRAVARGSLPITSKMHILMPELGIASAVCGQHCEDLS